MEKGTFRADLHNHLLIGFEPSFVVAQGYKGKNLTQVFYEKAKKRRIDISAITSQQHEIPRHSVHDRFYQLFTDAISLPPEYSVELMGSNIMIIQKRGEETSKPLFIVNGQTVIVDEPREKRYIDHLVIGSNAVPNHKSLQDTINYCQDKGLIQIAEHPYLKEHFGIGQERLEKHLEDYDAIEGFNAQMIWPKFMKIIPGIGIANRDVNEKAKQFALERGKPYIATSDTHSPECIGVSHTIFESEAIDLSSEEKE